ncbi:MAG: lipoprotein [Pseudomonadales bacterium]
MRLSLLVVLVLSVATCGQKGPLYLPEPQAKGWLQSAPTPSLTGAQVLG